MKYLDPTPRYNVMMLLYLVVNFCIPEQTVAQSQEVNEHYISELLEEVSNWGRWGDDDELGTLNFINEQIRVSAASQVKSGVSISLSLDLNTQQSLMNPNPMEHHLQVVDFAGDTWAVDTYTMNYHGYAYSHIDALCHLIYKGKMYNDFPQELAKPTGTERLGIQNMSKGILARGIIVDIPRLKGVNYLEPGAYVMPEDLEAWEARTGINVGRGDILLIRTGRWAKEEIDGPWNYTELAAGLHPSVVSWLHQREVAVLGSDGASERYPSGMEGSQSPIHFLVIYGLGMPILDNLDLEELSAYAAKTGRYEFMFTAAPLRVKGGTGSPLNPIATF